MVHLHLLRERHGGRCDGCMGLLAGPFNAPVCYRRVGADHRALCSFPALFLAAVEGAFAELGSGMGAILGVVQLLLRGLLRSLREFLESRTQFRRAVNHYLATFA